jgi:hypothetical protein
MLPFSSGRELLMYTPGRDGISERGVISLDGQAGWFIWGKIEITLGKPVELLEIVYIWKQMLVGA